jgi:Domain of unknown function (DUF4397)
VKKICLNLLAIFIVLININAACRKVKPAEIPDIPIVPVVDSFPRVMFINASPNAPGFDILVNDVKVDDNKVNYPNNTGYKKVKLDSNNIKVNIAGSTFTYFSEIKYLSKNVRYSFFIADSISKKSHLFLTDDLSAPNAGKAKVRFMHLSPNTPALDIIVASNGNVLFGNRSFKSATGFTNLTAGNYNFELKLAGTSTVKYVAPAVNFEDGKIYTFFIKGFSNAANAGESLGVQVINHN